MTATLDDGEDASVATKELQAKAEGLVEDHKNGLLKSINELYELSNMQQEMVGLQHQLKTAQMRLEDIRRAHPTLSLSSGE